MQKNQYIYVAILILDLLKHDIHTGTKNFLDIMYNFGLPLIVKPSRISDVNATFN